MREGHTAFNGITQRWCPGIDNNIVTKYEKKYQYKCYITSKVEGYFFPKVFSGAMSVLENFRRGNRRLNITTLLSKYNITFSNLIRLILLVKLVINT